MTIDTECRYQKVPSMRKFIASAVGAISLLAATAPTSAQSTFHLKEQDFDKGKWVFETINSGFSGFPQRADRLRASHELGLAYGVTDWWLPKVLIAFDKEALEGADYQLRKVLFENTFKLRALEENKDGLGLAWFQAFEWGVHRGETNAAIFGPILTGQLGKFSATLNPFVIKTFGNHREPGTDLYFAWQGRYEVMDKVKIGLEGYTTWPEVGASAIAKTGAGIQNRIGPVLIFEVDLPGAKTAGGGPRPGGHAHGAVPSVKGAGHGNHAEIELGVLFGTTDATQDVTGKINMHVSF